MKNAIVIVVDRLGAGHIGPYGNTWIETVGFNRLAAQSMLVEFALTDSVDLARVYRSYWQGIHAAKETDSGATLPETIQPTAIQSVLITDSDVVPEMPGADAFDERRILEPPLVEAAAADVNQTEMARLFATAIDWLATSPPEPFLLWVHSRGMDGMWDAPTEYRQQFADEEDPEPPSFVSPPARRLDADFDPDELLGIQQAYAGQVALVDLCLETLCESFAKLALAGRTLLTVTSPRGYPLGEHRCVGPVGPVLYEESTHVPWILRLPSGDGAAVRLGDLVQPPDLFATLRDWLELDEQLGRGWGSSLLPLAVSNQLGHRDRACTQTNDCTAFRTPAWSLHRHPGRPDELFAKPDDRLEANEVSSLCPEAVEQLLAAMAEFQTAAQTNGDTQLAPLSRLLAQGLD